MSIENKEAEFIATRVVLTRLKGEIQKSIVGQEKTIDQILWAIFPVVTPSSKDFRVWGKRSSSRRSQK